MKKPPCSICDYDPSEYRTEFHSDFCTSQLRALVRAAAKWWGQIANGREKEPSGQHAALILYRSIARWKKSRESK